VTVPAWRELQAVFRGAMLGDEDGALRGLVLDDGLSASARLRLYRNHVASTLTDTLRAAYPVVARLVGDGFFAYAVDRYLRDDPPAGPCLFEYGDAFAGFLAGFAPCARLAYLPDVARLEWALCAARHAPEPLPLAADALRTLPPADAARLTLRFHPSVSLLESPWPIDRIWLANQPEREAGVVDLSAGGACLEVRRLDDDPVFRALPPGAYAFRRALTDGRRLDAAARAAGAADPGFDLAMGLHDLLRDGVLVGFAVALSEEETA